MVEDTFTFLFLQLFLGTGANSHQNGLAMHAQGPQKCIGGSHCRVGADCADCYNADDRVGMSEDAIMHCSYAMDLGNAQ